MNPHGWVEPREGCRVLLEPTRAQYWSTKERLRWLNPIALADAELVDMQSVHPGLRASVTNV